MIKSAYPNNLKFFRTMEGQHLTQKAFVDACKQIKKFKLSISQVSKMEAGEYPISNVMIPVFAQVLRVNSQLLLDPKLVPGQHEEWEKRVKQELIDVEQDSRRFLPVGIKAIRTNLLGDNSKVVICAKKAGLKIDQWYAIEHGTRPLHADDTVAAKVAKALGFKKFEDLMGRIKSLMDGGELKAFFEKESAYKNAVGFLQKGVGTVPKMKTRGGSLSASAEQLLKAAAKSTTSKKSRGTLGLEFVREDNPVERETPSREVAVASAAETNVEDATSKVNSAVSSMPILGGSLGEGKVELVDTGETVSVYLDRELPEGAICVRMSRATLGPTIRRGTKIIFVPCEDFVVNSIVLLKDLEKPEEGRMLLVNTDEVSNLIGRSFHPEMSVDLEDVPMGSVMQAVGFIM